jgi:hypothetical protein
MVAAVSGFLVFPVVDVLAVIASGKPMPSFDFLGVLVLIGLTLVGATLSGLALLPFRRLRLPWAAVLGAVITTVICFGILYVNAVLRR